MPGIQTPGTIVRQLRLGAHDERQTQFTTYATRSRTSTDGKMTVTQASADSGGKSTQIADGEYLYTFGNKVPAGFDATATHRVAMYGSRNLTEFDLGTFYDDATSSTGSPPAASPRRATSSAPRPAISATTSWRTMAARGGASRSASCATRRQTTEPTHGTPSISR